MLPKGKHRHDARHVQSGHTLLENKVRHVIVIGLGGDITILQVVEGTGFKENSSLWRQTIQDRFANDGVLQN